MTNLDLLLSLYDVKTIVDTLFPEKEREEFLKELEDYKRSFWRRFFKKEPFESYIKQRKLPYEKWGKYRKVLDQIAEKRSSQLESFSCKVREKTGTYYPTRDDLNLLETAFLLYLLHDVLSGSEAEATESRAEPGHHFTEDTSSDSSVDAEPSNTDGNTDDVDHETTERALDSFVDGSPDFDSGGSYDSWDSWDSWSDW